MIRYVLAALGLAGLALASALVIDEGVGAVLSALAAAGPGVALASLYHVVPMAANAQAWRLVVPPSPEYVRPRLGFFVWTVWVRESVNNLLPVARIGGEVATARLLTRAGLPGPTAVASLVADTTLCIGAQVIFTLAGLALFFLPTIRETGGSSSDIAPAALGAIAIGLGLVGLLAALQRLGLFGLLQKVGAAMLGERVAALAGSAERLDRAITAAYARPSALIGRTIWQLLGFALVAGELWIVSHWLGEPLDLAEAIILEALVQAAASAAFVVPGALGVQEAAFLLVGGGIGLSAEAALALALTRRARDLLVFGPGLVLWQIDEGRSFFRRKRAS